MRQLTSSDVDELEGELRRERATVLEAIRARLAGRDDDEQRVLINYFADSDSSAAAQLTEADLILLRHELADLDAIDTALKRIDFGAGGLCTVCGNPIPLPRLRATPTTQTCLACQSRIAAQDATSP